MRHLRSALRGVVHVSVKVEAVQVAGFALVTAGLWDIYRPAGLIFAGLALVVLAEIRSQRKGRE